MYKLCNVRNEKKIIGIVLSSGARKNVLKFLLKNGPSRPSEIAIGLPYDQPYTSRVLINLEQLGVVECLTPEKKAWRVYALTSMGKKICNNLFK